MNGDGKPDIVTSNYRDNEVSVLLNLGHGKFDLPRMYAVGEGPNEVQIADVNGDGRPDLIAANYGSNTVSVLMGNGDGTFKSQQTFPAGSGPASVAVADLNRDGKLDLVVGNRNASSVTLLDGNGDGTFDAPIPFGLGKNRYAIAVADLNGDGKPDVVATHLLQNSAKRASWERHGRVRVRTDRTSRRGTQFRYSGRPESRRTTRPGDHELKRRFRECAPWKWRRYVQRPAGFRNGRQSAESGDS